MMVESISSREIAFGYSPDDLYSLAGHSVRTDRSRPWINHEERVDAAYCAMVEVVLTSSEPPFPRDLIYVGRQASAEIVGQDMRHHGIDKRGSTYGQQRVNFARYWIALGDDPACDKTVDRVALGQIWPRLSEPHREALGALATWRDYERASEYLGLRYHTFCARVRKARLAFLRLWHEGEVPSTVWGRDRRQGRQTGLTAIRVFARRAGAV